MGTFTLTGPGASVDRSQNNPLTWTWARTLGANEFLHRWRLQYRTVGSGTWLNAAPSVTNLLPNGSAEAGVLDWLKGGAHYNATLSQVAGGRPGGGSAMAKLALDYVSEYPNGVSSYEALHPFSNTISVVPGARYVVDGWAYSDHVGGGGLYFLWYKADMTVATGGSGYFPGTHRASQWEMFANEVVAPSDAAYARVKISNTARDDGIGWASTVYYDDLRMYRVDNAQPNAVADAGGNAWSGRYCGNPQTGTVILTPNFLAAGNWEFRIEAWTSSYASPVAAMTQAFSNTVTSTMVTAAAAPTITSPAADGATIATNPANVTVTYASGQTQLQIRVMDGTTEVYNSGTLTVSGTSSTQSVPFPTNSVSRQIQARTGTGGVFSAWATRNVSVSYTPPATPSVSAIATDWQGIGQLHAVRATVTSPAPTGTQPAVVDVLLYWRVVGSSIIKSTGASEAGGSPLITWEEAPNLPIQVSAVARAANGTSTASAWVTVSPALAIKGVILFDPNDPITTYAFRYNDDGVEDEHEVESALLQYSGREYPVVEYGAATARVLKVPVLHLRSDAERDRLRLLCTRRAALVYKDKRGRAVLGRVTMGAIKDTTYGYITSLAIDVLDSWGA